MVRFPLVLIVLPNVLEGMSLGKVFLRLIVYGVTYLLKQFICPFRVLRRQLRLHILQKISTLFLNSSKLTIWSCIYPDGIGIFFVQLF